MPELNPAQLEAVMNGHRTDPSVFVKKAEVETPSAEPIIAPPVLNAIPAPEVVTPTTIPVETTPPSWLDQYRLSTGHDAKSEEEIKSIVERAGKSTSYEEQIAALSKERDEFRSKSELSPFANEYEAKRNELIKSGISKDQLRAFEKVNEVDLTTSTPLESMKLALQLRDGLTPREAEIFINNRYRMDTETFSGSEIENDAIMMKVDAKRDLEFLQGYKVTVSTVPPSPAEANMKLAVEQDEARTRQAEPVIRDILSNLDPFKGFSLNGKTGAEAQTIDLPMVANFKENIAPMVSEFVKREQINAVTTDGRAKIVDFVTNMAKINNYESAVKHAFAEGARGIRESNDNPSVLSRGAESGTAQEKSKFDAYREGLISGKNRR